MIDVKEHVYHDDPKAGHPDVRTQLRNVSYYFIGNGLVQAAVQHAPAGEGTPYGLLLMDPKQLKMKREALSLDPGTGLERTMLFIRSDGAAAPLKRDKLTVRWDKCDGVPAVRVEWKTRMLDVSELFYCPDRSTARLTREIHLRNHTSTPCRCSVETGIRSQTVARDLNLAPGREIALSLVYSMGWNPLQVAFEFADQKPSILEARRYWNAAARVQFESPRIDHLFQAAAFQLPSVISRTGRMDAGIWQYLREWVRDQAIMAHALAQLEPLWNQGWKIGGYGRYHMDSDPDSPGPWPFASLYIACAYLERREWDKVWRVIDWLASLPQYPSGAFFEMYGDRIAPPYAQNGIVAWSWAETITMVVKNILGFQPEEDAIRMRPRLLPGFKVAKGVVPFRGHRVLFQLTAEERIDRPRFEVSAKHAEADGDSVRIPFADADICIEGKIPAQRMTAHE